MDFKYAINSDLFEVGIIVSNHGRWKGLANLVDVLEIYKNKLDDILYDFFYYCLLVLQDGRDPSHLSFILEEELEKIKFENNENYQLHKNCRTVLQIVKWMHKGESDQIEMFLDLLEDRKYAAKYQDWRYVNQFRLSLTFQEYLELTREERREIIISNEYVCNYYKI